MTFTEIKTEFTNRSDDQVDDAQIGRWINQAYQTVIGACETFPFNVIRAKDTTQTTTNGTAAYSLPSGFVKFIKLYVGTDEYTRLDIEDTVDTSNLSQKFALTSSTQYTIYPTPTVTGTQITLFYEKAITEMSATTDEPMFAARYHEILVYGALERYHEREKEMSKAAFYRTQFNNVLARLIDFYTRGSKDDVLRMQSLMESTDY